MPADRDLFLHEFIDINGMHQWDYMEHTLQQAGNLGLPPRPHGAVQPHPEVQVGRKLESLQEQRDESVGVAPNTLMRGQ